MKKVMSYIVSLIGLLIFISGVKFFNEKAIGLIPFLEGISSFYLMVVGIVIVLVGIFFLARGSSESVPKEVPIYKGKKIVGYRR